MPTRASIKQPVKLFRWQNEPLTTRQADWVHNGAMSHLAHIAREDARLTALRALELLDTPPEAEFDAIVAGARHLFDCKIAYVALIDANRQWFKASCGLD